jgi:cell division septum initiation protein DivIVA
MNETESLRARIASLEAEIASHHKRRAAMAAREAYKAYASTHAREIADEAADLFCRLSVTRESFPRAAGFLELRKEADRLRKEVQP